MGNELREMQEFIRQRNKTAGTRLGQTDPYEVTDDEGFGPPAPAPMPEGKDIPQVLSVNPKVELEQYQVTKYPPKVQAIDLEARQVIASNGKFAMTEEEVRQAIALAINAMQRSFEKILQTLVDQAGLSVPSGQQTAGDASTQPDPEESAANTITTTQAGRTGRRRTPNVT